MTAWRKDVFTTQIAARLFDSLRQRDETFHRHAAFFRRRSAPAPAPAREEAQLRRYKQFSGASGGGRVLTHGDLTLDRDSVTVTAGGKDVTLTAREFEILALLMEYPKKVFTREQIYQHVWGEDYFGDDNTVNVHISNLRSKLGKASDREYIKTVWGIGFKMAEV